MFVPVTLAPLNVTNNKYTTHKVHETAHKCITHILKQHNSLEENIKGYSHDRNQERKDDSKGRQSLCDKKGILDMELRMSTWISSTQFQLLKENNTESLDLVNLEWLTWSKTESLRQEQEYHWSTKKPNECL